MELPDDVVALLQALRYALQYYNGAVVQEGARGQHVIRYDAELEQVEALLRRYGYPLTKK